MNQFTKEELTNLAVLLKRATVNGNEAVALVGLLNKIGAELIKLDNTGTETKEEVTNKSSTKQKKG